MLFLKLWIVEKSQAEQNYLTLADKHMKIYSDFELLKENSLRSKNELVEQMNMVNELEKELSDRV